MRRTTSALILLVFTAALCACERRVFTPALTLTSPRGTYTVDVFGPLGRPTVPGMEYNVRVTARRGLVVLAERHEVHFADWFDTAFADEYGPSRWPAENVLKFPSAFYRSASNGDSAQDTSVALPPDLIVVKNAGVQALPLLAITSGDLFVAFDLKPGAELRLEASPQGARGDLSWVQVSGRWADGNPLPSTGANFVLPRPAHGQFIYQVELDETGVRLRELGQHARMYGHEVVERPPSLWGTALFFSGLVGLLAIPACCAGVMTIRFRPAARWALGGGVVGGACAAALAVILNPWLQQPADSLLVAGFSALWALFAGFAWAATACLILRGVVQWSRRTV